MTQRQPLTHQEYLASLRFYSVTSICNWAGHYSTGEIQFLDADVSLPYIEKNGTWYYFGLYPEREYRLVCTADKDLGAENGN